MMAHYRISLAVLAMATGLGAVSAQAQTASNLGGGFLELLVTGRDPTPRPWLAQPAAAPTRAPQAALPPRPAPPRQAAMAIAPGRIEAEDMQAPGSQFARQEVAYDGPHGAGAIVVDTPRRFLFLVLGNGKALRYGVRVGRDA